MTSISADPMRVLRRHDGALLLFLEVPNAGHTRATSWRSTGLSDFEDALQVVCGLAGQAEVIITRNLNDFAASIIPAMTPEEFLTAYSMAPANSTPPPP